MEGKKEREKLRKVVSKANMIVCRPADKSGATRPRNVGIFPLILFLTDTRLQNLCKTEF